MISQIIAGIFPKDHDRLAFENAGSRALVLFYTLWAGTAWYGDVPDPGEIWGGGANFGPHSNQIFAAY